MMTVKISKMKTTREESSDSDPGERPETIPNVTDIEGAEETSRNGEMSSTRIRRPPKHLEDYVVD